MLQSFLKSMKTVATKKIFISYRVQDTAGETGRLVDALKQHFTDEQIFLDIENLEPGSDYTVAIEKSLDTCDVFLAVIGPHWTGDREGNALRIQDPNDWVRLEVATALQRNIRVVPVLVDGAVLPKTEQLPPDLQPLLRRQSFEISNKRWRYDTDQLVKFLVNTAGIQPLKSPLQTDTLPAANPRKRRSLVYIGAGFVLAIALLVIIGSLLPEEKKDTSANTTTQQTTQQNVLPATDEQTRRDDTQQTASGVEDIAGTWEGMEDGVVYFFVLAQDGNRLRLQMAINGQVITTGTGEINGKNVELNYALLGVSIVLKATLSPDGNSMTGAYTESATGEVTPVHLTRRF
jgi:hypothetical protein